MMPYEIFSHGKILNIAHRGYELKAPENTLAAFRTAMDAGADGIELDLQMTKDGCLVALHDPTLGRTTNGSGKVRHKTLQELKTLDAGSWFAPRFAGERIPTLDEVFMALPRDAILAIETKPFRANADIARKIVASVKKHRAEKRVIVLSYNPAVLVHCRRLAPEIPAMLIQEPSRIIGGALAGYRIFTRLCPDIWAIEWFVLEKYPDLAARLHRRGFKIFSGGTPGEKEMRLVRDLGVDGMITSDPAALKRVLEEQ